MSSDIPAFGAPSRRPEADRPTIPPNRPNRSTPPTTIRRSRRGKAALGHPVDRSGLSPARRADPRAARDDAARSRPARGHEPGEGAPLSGEFPAAWASVVAGPGVGPLRTGRLRVANGTGAAGARRWREARAHRACRIARPAGPDGGHRGVGQSGADRRALDGVELSGEGVAEARRRDAVARLGDRPAVCRVSAAQQDAAMLERELADSHARAIDGRDVEAGARRRSAHTARRAWKACCCRRSTRSACRSSIRPAISRSG